jgi:hypothetical protein
MSRQHVSATPGISTRLTGPFSVRRRRIDSRCQGKVGVVTLFPFRAQKGRLRTRLPRLGNFVATLFRDAWYHDATMGGRGEAMEKKRGASTRPTLTAEIFVIPLTSTSYIVYAPLRRAAFVANASMVNFLASLQQGDYDAAGDPGTSLVAFLRRLQILDGDLEAPPNSTFSGPPEPTSITLFLTTACNLRCTYCYASVTFHKLGDHAARGWPV